ncbi:uncharacterized protein CG4449 [Scaptodrosophila lebanonensis]|uniref:Uncharacterized protein CG4449 n=1 Tax=Drosophila lebanonensis TaxID=7225 RepID=A0A6J2T483_DROLE|nr:uncharacterized protein CG4449 [Scaptodrosophila lebanonensis]
MSDDDCDIFSISRKRAQAQVLPQKIPSLVDVPCERAADYDFITKKDTKVKKAAKYSKIKETKQTEIKKNVRKNAKKCADSEELEVPTEPPPSSLPSVKTGAVLPEAPPLSPISQMIFEMEQKKIGDMENLPVARRTRSSHGKRQPLPEPDDIVEKAPSPPKRRGRKSRAAAASSSAAVLETFLLGNTATRSQKTRRQAVAEIAAHAPVVDSVDLVSAVVPRVEGFVNLNSDEENEEPVDKHVCAVEEDFDWDNPLVDVSLCWLGEIQVYKLRKYQKFSHIFKEIAERNNVAEKDILINLDAHFIQPNESPNSIDLQIYHIINGRAVNNNKTEIKSKDHKEIYDHQKLLRKPKNFQLKVQADEWKKPLIIPLDKSETFKILYIKCAEELNCKVQEIRLLFDGEFLDINDTPENQDMEGNEMIDLRFVK